MPTGPGEGERERNRKRARKKSLPFGRNSCLASAVPEPNPDHAYSGASSVAPSK